MRPSRLVAAILAPLLALTAVGVTTLVAASVATAAPIPAPSASIALQQTGGYYGDADTKPFILAGEDATFSVSVTNGSMVDGFNTALTLLVPNGVDFVSSGGMGSPVLYASGEELPNSSKSGPPSDPYSTVPAGFQLWVFEDVADLPAGATYGSSLVVRPDAAVFPVGSAPEFDLTGYVSSDPAMKPIFDGSTGVAGLPGLAETSFGTADTTAPVEALRLTKHEPSPEIELLRGVHDHPTVYTLTVEYTPEGDTTGVTVVDWLPAGLEFLGCGLIDQTAVSPQLYDGAALGGTQEYPGSGPMGTAGDPGDCVTPVSVSTVSTGIPATLDPGVYTRVEWALADLTGGTPQPTDLSAAGTVATAVLKYVAAVPLFENTLDFVTDADGTTTGPSTSGFGHAANLNNNNGASTRQGQGAGFGDGILYDNLARVSGTYTGPVFAPADTAAFDTDSEQIQAMDLRILKGVDTGSSSGGDALFRTGYLAAFTLDLDTSEYTSADQIVITDTIPNGLCPAIPVQAVAPTLSGDPLPADCDYPFGGAGATVTGAQVTGIGYNATSGEFQLVLVPDAADMTDNDSDVITYTALMRDSYDTDVTWTGPTTSGDGLTNHVEFDAWTHSISDLADVTNDGQPTGVPAFGDEDVWDDSQASIESEFSGIDKRVLPRDDVIATAPAPATAADSCDVAPSGGWQDTQDAPTDLGFRLGDVVCYELTVDFASEIDVRNPIVTDFLPVGVDLLGYSIYGGTGGTTGGVAIDSFVQNGKSLRWLVGTPGMDGDRFVPLGSRLVIHLLGQVVSLTPNDSAVLDKPENLMKYRQVNVLDDVYFLRDASAIQVEHGVSLLKGVRDVDGDATLPAQSENDPDGTVFDSNRDGIQVAQGEVVTYRVDLTTPPYDVQDLVVWDALPAGIEKADVSSITDGGVALNPGDGGYPADLDPAFAGRSVIVWTGIDLVASVDRTLTYAVTIPPGTEIATTLPNTASITAFDVVLNTGETTTYYPEDSLDAATHPVDAVIDGAGTRDDSGVYLPAAPPHKVRVATEVGPNAGAGEVDLGDPNNGSAQAVQGELVTWRYSVDIPAHTTVSNAVLRDRGTLTPGNVPYTVAATPTWSASAISAPYMAGDFTLSGAGALGFPASYTNTSNATQTFEVELVVYLADPTNTNSTTYTNQAQFRSDTWDDDATATVVYREPNPQINKSASPSTDLVGGQTVTYTIQATNPGANRPTSWDTVINDCVPASLLDVTLVGAPAGVVVGTQGTSCDIAPGTANGTSITWTLGALAGGATPQFQYTVELPPVPSGNDSYVNTAMIAGYTLPADVGGDDTTGRRGTRTASDTQTLSVAGASITKSVSPTSAPIGDTVDYTVTVTLPPNVQFYDTTITDTLPTGLDFGTVTGWTTTGSGAPTQVAPSEAGQVLAWDLGDIPSSTDPRTIEIVFTATLTDAVAVAAPVNDVELAWNRVNGDPTTRQTRDDDATVTVLNPVLGILKSVSDGTPDPGQVFDYTVTVTNSGNTPAYNAEITDVVPVGVVVDESTISGGGVLTGDDPVTGGGTIAWTITGPLSNVATPPGNNQATFTYEATLAPSSGITDTQTFTNTATVDHYESFPTGGRSTDPTNVDDDAVVDPAFPDLDLAKSVTGGEVAYAGVPFSWTITATNNGNGPAQTATVTDTLPGNWQYTAVSSITINGTPYGGALAPAVTGAGTPVDPQVLEWDFGSASPATPILPPGQSIVIVVTATPQTAALTIPGVTHVDPGPVVVRPPHTNSVVGEATDTSDADENGSGPYAPDDASDDAFIHAADLVLVKTASATPLVAGGAAATAWTITVSNDGPDTAVGPFEVTDEWGAAGILPDGLSVTAFSGTGWTCAPTTTTGFECERTNANDTLASGASFPAITVTAQADADFDPADTPIDNSASVGGQSTYDPDPSNNDDSDDVDVVFSADLAIVKTGPGATPNAGGPITWTVTVSNDGPSDSVSTTADPISVTDEIPSWVSGVQVAAPLPTGWSLTSPGPFEPTNVIELVAADGYVLADGASVQFTLTGTIDADLPDGTTITNAAEVIPGDTPDPESTNNESSVDSTPDTDTTISIAKTRQVFVGGVWVDATSADVVLPGTPVSYLITVANTGIADARAVTVVDEVPAYLDYDAYTSVSGTWTRTTSTDGPGVDQAFDLTGNLVPGASAALRVTLDVASDHTGDVINVATGEAENAPQVDDDDDSGSERSADLSITKTHTGDATAGSAISYTITVTNNGPSYSSGPIEIGDTLPSDFSYATGTATVSVAGGAAAALEPAVSGQDLTWEVGSTPGFELADGDTIVIVFDADVSDDAIAGSYLNAAAVDGPDDDNPVNDGTTDPTTVVTSADLAIVKDVATAGPYVAGTSVDYTLTVTNAGPSVAIDALISETAPTGTTITAMSGTGWICDPSVAECEAATLPVGTTTISVTLAIDAGVLDATSLTNTASVDSSTDDPDTTDNTDDETIVTSTSADLAIVKTAVDADGVTEVFTATAGTQLRYLLEVTNAGPSDAIGPLTIEDTLPTGFSYVGVESGGTTWSCAVDLVDPQLVECESTAGLASGASATDLVLIVAIDPAQAVGSSTNSATVSSPTPDPDTSDNTDDATVTVAQLVDLSIVKTHSAGSVQIGEELEFDLAIANDGPSVATGVVVVDTVPAGLEVIDADGTDPAWSVVVDPPALDGTTTVTATLAGPLGVGASAPALRITVLVHPEAYAQVANVAAVSGDQPDSDVTNDESTDDVIVPPQVELTITKQAVGTFQVGSNATYRITVGNSGPTEDPGPVIITDPLPLGLTYQSATSPDATCSAVAQLVTCTVTGAIAVGDEVVVTLVVAVGQDAYPSVENIASVSSASQTLLGSVLTADATANVAAAPLANTGSNLAVPGLIALMLLALGGLVLGVRRLGTRR